ncbi:DUF4304 domain-containing protein [Aquimarina sp. M1]
MRPEREFAVDACKELESSLSKYGFTTLSKGLRFKRRMNSDITQEILFQITSNLDIIANINVRSKQVNQWNKKKYNRNSDLIFGCQLGYLTPLQDYKTWCIMKSNTTKKQFQDEVLFQIEEYIIPLFDKFNNTDALIDELTVNHGDWSIYRKNEGERLPIKFVLVYGTKLKAQELLDSYLNKYRYYISNIKESRLTEMKNFEYTVSEFYGAIQFKIALNNSLNIS